MHILDFIMYIIILGLLLWVLGDEYTSELGGIVGMLTILIYTVAYIVLFVIVDYNWIAIVVWVSKNTTL